nr:hypothetical protein [Lachnospiraceae bacterium]
MTFKMYNAAGNALQFGNSQTIMPDDYDYDEKNFSANDYLEQVRDSVMSGTSIKENATPKEKATYDLSRALLNYGEWSNFYFNKTNEPLDGNYANATNGISYPSWWTSKDYWASALDAESSESFNAMLQKTAAPTVNYSSYHVEGNLADTKLSFPYVVSLILEDGVKARLYFSPNQNNPSVILNGSTHLNTISENSSGDKVVRRYVETSLIKFGSLSESLAFNVNYGEVTYQGAPVELIDTATFSPISFARLVAIDKPGNDYAYEESGLANTLRAMVTVETATYMYKNATA